MAHSRWNAPKAHGEHTAYGNTPRSKFRDLLADCLSFEGHSMWATWHGNLYTVYSYDQVIAVYDPTDGTLHLNEYKYSNKTTEHQTTAAAWTGKRTFNQDRTFGVQYEIMWDGEPDHRVGAR